MWVEKVPRRSDFCGCPGCPLCYNWVEPLVVDHEVTQESKKPSFQEIMKEIFKDLPAPQSMEEYEFAHAYVRNLGKDNPEEQARIDAEFRERDEVQALTRFLDYARRNPKKEPIKPLNTITCDSIGGEVIEAREREKEAKQWVTAEVDPVENAKAYQKQLDEQNKLIQRERQMAPVGATQYNADIGAIVRFDGKSWVVVG